MVYSNFIKQIEHCDKDFHSLLIEIFSDESFSYKFKNFPIYINRGKRLFSSRKFIEFRELYDYYDYKVEDIFEINLAKLVKVILDFAHEDFYFEHYEKFFERNLDLFNEIYKLGIGLTIDLIDPELINRGITYNKSKVYITNFYKEFKVKAPNQFLLDNDIIEISGKNEIEEFVKIFTKIIYNEIKEYIENIEISSKIIKKINFNNDVLGLINNLFYDRVFYDIFKNKLLKFSIENNNNIFSLKPLLIEEENNDNNDIENKFERNLKQFMKFTLNNYFDYRTIFEQNKDELSKVYELGEKENSILVSSNIFLSYSNFSVIIYNNLYDPKKYSYNSFKIEGKEKINKFLQILYNMLEKEINKFETDVPDFFD